MILLSPKIKEYRYKTGTSFWLVSCSLPNGERYRQKHSSEDEANLDRTRIIREFNGGGLNRENLKIAEMAMQKLEHTSNPDAHGKDILTAVEWFLTHYEEKAFELTLSEYIKDFIGRKEKRRSKNTVDEIEFYLNDLEESFGHLKPSETGWQFINQHLEERNHIYHRYKVLHHFFGWLANDAKDISKLEKPPLSSNPLKHIEKPKQKRGRPLICNVDEVIELIKKSIEEDFVTWFVWGFFSGMRPESEMIPFWENPELGWRLTDLIDGKIIVSDEIEKTGRRTREIKIMDNFREWIDLFKSNPKKYPMLPKSRKRKFHDIKFAVLLEKKARENDIMRHTFISNLSRIEPIGEVCFQCATSMSMIRKNYKVLITDMNEVERFQNIRPRDFGLN